VNVVHLMASPFYGGPERQMLGLARHLPSEVRSTFLSFAEGGKCEALLSEARKYGFEANALTHNFPHVGKAIAELADDLKRLNADVLTCSGYKPDILGWRAARRAGIPCVIVSHGWTAATWKVRLYESIDRFVHRRADACIGVSEAQSAKLRAAGVAEERIATIKNAVGAEAFAEPDATYRDTLRTLFASPPKWIVGAAGRLSREKGMDQLVEAAARVHAKLPEAGFVIFGDGPQRELLTRRIADLGLQDTVILAGFRHDVGKFLPHLDLAVLPSYTEGLPVILLEEAAAGLPIVATTVGGVPEVIEDGVTGRLAPPGDPQALAERIVETLGDPGKRRAMGDAVREKVRREFSFELQAEHWMQLLRRLTGKRNVAAKNELQHASV
jgi:glycosyltransferase involved in cell wall biosynthesis